MRTVLVTGGSSDIGRAISEMLVESGWQVIAPSRKDLDLADLHTISHKAKKLVRDVLTLDAIIHVAGVWHDDESSFNKDLEDYTTVQIADAMNVGLTGFMILLSVLIPLMPKNGTVIGISGIFSDAKNGADGWLPYYVSKRGLEDLLVGLAQDYPYGPHAYGISPAGTATKALGRFFPEDMAAAQPAAAIAAEVHQLLAKPRVSSGGVVTLRNAVARPGFHK